MEDEDFVLIMGVIDGKLTVQKKNTKTSILTDNYYESEKEKKIHKYCLLPKKPICVGNFCWKFCVQQGKPENILLALEPALHPHTAESIKICVGKCIHEKEKVITTTLMTKL